MRQDCYNEGMKEIVVGIVICAVAVIALAECNIRGEPERRRRQEREVREWQEQQKREARERDAYEARKEWDRQAGK